MKKHLLNWHEVFIGMTGIAAFIHSVWSLGTLFGGEPPAMAITPEFMYWIVPASLIAFTLEVGQVATSTQIRGGKHNPIKYLTYGFFALFTFYLQWLYMAHHMPALELSEGVRGDWLGLSKLMRDSALWVVPAMMPISTMLYTVSADHAEETPIVRTIEIKPVLPDLPDLPEVPQIPAKTEYESVQALENGLFATQCSDCEWQGVYESALQARQAHNGHVRRCPQRVAFSSNGHKEKV